ncbi:hypothetical protein BDV27DRAFT_137185 [Aspergillus caelatus]|uniref:Uncharacterized protein n=1 Tax=Aspergillus caelatus TaxID=61420 RepID=A0A5N6ZMB6_9EURO|nr:uncharacterized protein BDV27DRAFT_137185 [Aspergillus caelatus]KAE8358752.1 hypothetical protein BDV27DRAFT_137185 [Aspergillus caelatus]
MRGCHWRAWLLAPIFNVISSRLRGYSENKSLRIGNWVPELKWEGNTAKIWDRPGVFQMIRCATSYIHFSH